MTELSAGWADSSVGELSAYISRGKSPKYAEMSALPVVNQKAIRWHGIQNEHLKYIHDGQATDWGEERFIRDGDILWNSTGTGTIGRACLVRPEHLVPPKVVDSHVTIVRPHLSAVDPRYLFAWIRGPEVQRSIEDLATGTTNQIELNRSTVAATRVPLAPLAEQRRIADKLDALLARVDRCRSHLDRVPGILKRFRQAVLAAACDGKLTDGSKVRNPQSASLEDVEILDAGGLPDIPSHWVWASFGSTLEELRNGVSPKPNMEPPGVPVLRISAVRPGSVAFDDMRYLPAGETFLGTYALANGDLLFTRYNGSLDLLGVCGMVRGLQQPTLYPDKLMRVRVKRNILLPEFVELFFGSPGARERLTDEAKSSAGQQGISGQSIKQQIIAVPPLDEQHEIVRRVDALFKLADTIEEHVAAATARAEKLTQAILAKAFRGELVPQDPNDEPAAVMLERLRKALPEQGCDERRKPGKHKSKATQA